MTTRKGFDELNELRDSVEALLRDKLIPARAVVEPGTFERLPRPSEAERLVSIIESDIPVYRERLQQLAARHRGRTGEAKRPSHYLAIMEIGNEYLNLIESIKATLDPVAFDLQEMLRESYFPDNQ